MSNLETPRDMELRERAIRNLKKRRDFHGHVLVYLLVNTFLVVIWWLTSSPDGPGDGWGFFWPVFLIVGWGIVVVMNGYDVYFAGDIDEAEIQGEIQRMQHRR